MNEYENFSSLPPNEERQFAIYEQRSQLAAKQATKLGMIVAGAVAAFVFIFALVVPPNETVLDLGDVVEEDQTDQLGAE